jgi:hypothetical protein
MLANARTASRADHGQLDPDVPFFMDRRAMLSDLSGVTRNELRLDNR